MYSLDNMSMIVLFLNQCIAYDSDSPVISSSVDMTFCVWKQNKTNITDIILNNKEEVILYIIHHIMARNAIYMFLKRCWSFNICHIMHLYKYEIYQFKFKCGRTGIKFKNEIRWFLKNEHIFRMISHLNVDLKLQTEK